MQVSVTFNVPEKNLTAILAQLASGSGVVANKLGDEPTPLKKKPGRPTKEEVAAREAAEAAALLGDEPEAEPEDPAPDEEPEAEPEAEPEEEPADEPAPEPVKAAKPKPTATTAPKGPTLEKDILPAVQAYAKKHGREKAFEVLAKFKAKSAREIPAAKFAEALKLLKA